MFGKRTQPPVRVLFLREAEYGGSLFLPDEVEEISAIRAKELITEGAVVITTLPLNRIQGARSMGDPSWRRQEIRAFQERRAAMQLPNESK